MHPHLAHAPALLLGVTLGCASHSPEMPAHHHFEHAEDWVGRFEDPARDAWQKPDQVLALLALAPDARVADVGAATGYFAVRAARLVPRGRVYGVDLEASMVAYLAKRAEREGLGNLTALLGAPDDARLPEPVDLVLVVDTYHHVEHRPAYFRRLLASVKPGGRLVIIDFKTDSSMGPPASAKLTPEAVTRELNEAGWGLQSASELLPEQYLLVFSRP